MYAITFHEHEVVKRVANPLHKPPQWNFKIGCSASHASRLTRYSAQYASCSGPLTLLFFPLGVCAVGKLFFFCQNLVERLALLLPSAGEAVRRQDGTYINNRPQRDVVYL